MLVSFLRRNCVENVDVKEMTEEVKHNSRMVE